MANIERVKYQNSPLAEVTFQLRFPTILSINTEQPAEFQNKIREYYPLYKENITQENNLILTRDGKFAQIPQGISKTYNFISQDGHYKVKLTSCSVSLSTLSYTKWEDFRDKIKIVIEVFEGTYNPRLYNRVGLHYVNIIQRRKLGLGDKKWTELIKPHILGIITEENEDSISSFSTSVEYKLPDKGIYAKPHFGLVNVKNEQEVSFLMECDYFKGGVVDIAEVNAILEKLHDSSSSFIRTSITDVLHNAMGPERI